MGPDEPFILDFKTGTNKPDDQFIAVISTQSMLENAIQLKIDLGKSFLIADTTYKLVEKK